MIDRLLLIVGAGGHGKVAADIARNMGYTDIAFLDDHPHETLRVVGALTDDERYIDTADFFVAIGNAAMRERLTKRLLSLGATVVNLIHPSAVVTSGVQLGRGVMVAAGAVIGVDARIGDGVIVNTLASVDHDSAVGEYSHIAVGAHVAGTVHIGRHAMLGAGSAVINNVDITDDVTIGAGACVVRTIEESGTYVGVPAKKKSAT